MIVGSREINKSLILSLISYFFTALAIAVMAISTRALGPSVISTIELFIIVMIVNRLFKLGKIVANFVKFVLLLLLNIQVFILLFSGTYTTSIMVTNLASIEALSGKATLYLTSTFLILFFSGMPTKEFDFDKKLSNYGVIFLVVLELTLLNLTQFSYSPMYSLYGLSREILSQFETRHRIANLETSKEDFYNTEVENFRDKPIEMVEKPNVILIFTEGLSQNIIDDTREIMPNVSNIQQQSLNFENYFNHSFATYRGLQGQLYSGYQFFDQDKNNLISLQQIFSMNGYSTKFINSEPKNDTFTKYLLDFEFDELVTTEKLSGPAETVSDKDLYDLLWSEIVKASTFDKPFFISTYSFGTHISLDSPDEKYGAGDDILLNRFYNLDIQIGKFIEKFNQSTISQNTILVFTTDHSTFLDLEFQNSFPNYQRNHGMIDEIPLFIYYKGISPEVIDVKGKNSISLSPTVLDYIDLTGPNYFLGQSLFNMNDNSNNIFNTTFVSENNILTTKGIVDGASVGPFDQKSNPNFINILEQYYAIKLQESD